MIDWESPSWGQDGQNVHYATNGSWGDTERIEDQ